jgi:RNA polymerase sigma-70 factor (ECF subfamily)
VPAWVQRLRAQAEARLELDPLRVHANHADFVWRTLQRMGLEGADAEDALQEVFLVVHRRLHTFDGSSQMSTWLFGICQKVAAAQRRRAHRWREQPSEDLDRHYGGNLVSEARTPFLRGRAPDAIVAA